MNEVIIDGVSVAECLYVENERCLNYILGYGCKDNPNCYFKQLQRAKAENEKLKEEIKIQDNLAEHFRKEALYWAKKAEEIIKEAENEEK